MPDGTMMINIEDSGYKYLGILEADGIKHDEMKEQLKKEYIRRVRNVLKSKLNGENIISAINSRAVLIVRYGAGIIKWTKNELEELNRKTRKLMSMYGAQHPRLIFSRFFDIPRNLGNVKEKPTRKTCLSREKSALLHASIRQNFASRHFFDVNGASIVIS